MVVSGNINPKILGESMLKTQVSSVQSTVELILSLFASDISYGFVKVEKQTKYL